MKILLADDDTVFRQRLAQAMIKRQHDVTQACHGGDAVALVKNASFDGVVIDLKMPQMNGLEALRDIMQLCPDLAVVILTGYGSIPSAMEAVRLGARDYLIKPTDVDQILAIFQRDEAALPLEEVNFTLPSLEQVEWEHIQRVLSDCQGNISEAARVLGLHRRSLQRKLQKYPPSR